MFKISQEKIAQRWDLLPDNLRDTISDQQNSDFIWQTCEEQHIPEEKIYTFLKISAYVLMGFIHPEDMSKEIQEITGIDKRIIDDICNKINSRIFNIVRDQIDKIYTFSNKGNIPQEIPTPTNTNGPVILSDIQNNSADVKIPIMPVINTTTAKNISDNKEDVVNKSAQENKNTATIDKKIPMPVILQNDSSFETVNKTSNFHVEISEDKMKEISKNPQINPVKPAKIEFGTINKNDQNSSVINLNNKKTSTIFDDNAINLNNNEKNRVFVEVTSEIPKPKNAQINEINIPAPKIPSPIQDNVFNGSISKRQTIPQIEKPIVSAQKVQSFFNPIIKDQNIPVKKEAVIQKNYSEADIVKPKNDIPTPKPPIQNTNTPVEIKEQKENIPNPLPFIIK
jgi:hypothetical protein